MYERLFLELDNALAAARHSLLADGLSDNEATREATRYVARPLVRQLDAEVLDAFVSLTQCQAMPAEFLAMVTTLDLSTLNVWDASLLARLSWTSGKLNDAYLSMVLDWSEQLRSDLTAKAIVVGATETGDNIVMTSIPTDGYAIFISDRCESSLVVQAAASFEHFLIANAKPKTSEDGKVG